MGELRLSKSALPRQAGAYGRSTDRAAAVAGPAAGRVLFTEILAEEYASTFLGLSVMGNRSESLLALVTESLELRDEFAGACSKAIERHGDVDAVLLIALDEAGLLKIRQQCLANPRRYAGRIRERCGGGGSMLVRPGRKCGLESHQVPDGRTAQSLKPLPVSCAAIRT